LQTARDLQQTEKCTEGSAEYRQAEAYSRQINVQKGRQTIDSQRPTADRETYRRAGRQQTSTSRQRHVQKGQQSTDRQRPIAGR
jgi:hypothetical protein